MQQAAPASLAQLQEFHSREYLAGLAHWAQLSERQRAAFGLEDDCAPFQGLYEFAALTAGGSLQAAAGLCSCGSSSGSSGSGSSSGGSRSGGACSLAVHLDGGRHHARKSRAAGFCYTNDVVRACVRACVHALAAARLGSLSQAARPGRRGP